MVQWNEVDFVQADAFLNELEAIDATFTFVGCTFVHGQSGVHVGNAGRPDAANSIPLVGADVAVVADAFEQPVEVVPDNGGVAFVDPCGRKHFTGGPIVMHVQPEEGEVVLKEVLEGIPGAIDVHGGLASLDHGDVLVHVQFLVGQGGPRVEGQHENQHVRQQPAHGGRSHAFR